MNRVHFDPAPVVDLNSGPPEEATMRPAVGFDCNGRVPTVDPVFPPDDEPADPPRSDREAARRWVRLLQWLASGGDARLVGSRVIVLATLLRLPDAPKSVRELGARLGVSHVTAWRLLKRVREEIARFSRETE